MLKYLFYTENHVWGGGNKYMSDLINGLKGTSINISVCCNKGGVAGDIDDDINIHYLKIFTRETRSYEKFINKYVYCIRFLLDQLFILLNVILFFLFLRKERPDKVVICNGGYPAALSCLSMAFATKLLGISAIMTIVSMPASKRKFCSLYDRLLDYCAWSSLDTVVVNCFSIRNSLVVLRAAPATKIRVIYNGIEKTKPKQASVSQARKVVIGCISRMDYAKGVIVLLDAFYKACQECSDINLQLILVGMGDAVNDLQKKVLQYNLDNVSLLGFYKGNVDNLLNNIDIFVLASFWEGLPYSIIEACRSGCAIIATDVGGIREVIRNHYSGILISSPSELELLDAIKFLIYNPHIAKQYGLRAQQTYEEKFNLQEMHKKVKRIFA